MLLEARGESRELASVLNALAVIAALEAAGVDVEQAISGLIAFGPPAGRGSREDIPLIGGGSVLLIDESYNANPASMQAALEAMAAVPRARHPRRVAVLGDMLELGARARELHVSVSSAITEAGIDRVFACGPNMRHLFDALPARLQGVWAETSADLEEALRHDIAAGDAVILLAAFWATACLWRARMWITQPSLNATVAFVAMGIVVTIALEWWATGDSGRWTYAKTMPTIPGLGTGVLPLLQWLLIPPLVVWLVRRQIR